MLRHGESGFCLKSRHFQATVGKIIPEASKIWRLGFIGVNFAESSLNSEVTGLFNGKKMLSKVEQL